MITKIDTTLCVVCSELRAAFANVSSEQMMKRIVNPLMSGIGLDNGVESYYEQWESHVLNDIKGYFGVDSIYDLKDEELAARLTSGFLKEIAKTDSFSKLTRLYLLAQVDWIHPQLISMGFDICTIEDAFMRMKALFADYNIILIYPGLFVDEMDVPNSCSMPSVMYLTFLHLMNIREAIYELISNCRCTSSWHFNSTGSL